MRPDSPHTPAIPSRCAQRPTAGGLVVPYVAFTHNGHATFGALDAERARTAFTEKLCQICGQPLNERAYVIVRPADEITGHSPEPALHPECLPYTAAHCPMLNGTALRYRELPVLATHPAGRACTDAACPCPAEPGHNHQARSGQLAEQYEAWMITACDYRLVFHDERPQAPVGISLAVPILRKRLLRKAALPPEAQRYLQLLQGLGL
ncbi:cell envelope biogenesis protein OmpA [Streptomyces sp. NPDC005799]|uniref:cell envelope biogenesis protein OmpA n=1 Tax=Streptomyces sp. NPDC005799 TaxID=3154678 RepID=UPI003410BEB5